ncbi:helix-turn-helix domain-containing protein [Leucobacter viscericola]|uniref:Glycerol operon regulatory protein n=1 Tax=Leucobacter viscericola TaxID=2714935 RepID=A0A6G7XGH1_9MICO|nr:IclR family transcriptional regulator C-terminal domain-containing protein [Leucobacter viscericola]QIK63643.1 helix-turn-helix domain-containing protein [Leucobacter viscericola]
MAEAVGEESAGDFVQSLARGLTVIRSFDAENPELSLSEVARRAEISPAAARRFLRTLETLGYVRSDGKRFALTPRVLELGFSYLSALSLPEIMQPHLEKLSRAVDESVSAAVLASAEIVYVARVPTRRIMSVGITIGTRFPAYATSMGRVLLAELPTAEVAAILNGHELHQLTKRTLNEVPAITEELARVRAQGWAIVDGELEVGLRSAAVPVRGRDGRVAAAVNISMSASRDSVEYLREHHLPLLLETAAAIEADLRLI